MSWEKFRVGVHKLRESNFARSILQPLIYVVSTSGYWHLWYFFGGETWSPVDTYTGLCIIGFNFLMFQRRGRK
jgi:hypothetical protein